MRILSPALAAPMGWFALLALLALHAAPLLAQDRLLQFDAASVRPSGPAAAGSPPGGRGGQVPNSPDRVTYSRVLFRALLMDAYGVQRDQITGPAWATADAIAGGALFDVSATAPAGATREQIAVMLQHLLEDRFALSVHRVRTEISGYALVAAKGGPRLPASAGPVRASEQNTTTQGRVTLRILPDGFPELQANRNMGGTIAGGTARLRFRDYPLADLVQQLSFALNAPVVDRTGLAGTHDFTLAFPLPENILVGSKMTLPLAPGRPAPLNGRGPGELELEAIPAISSAMEQQLGLKLESSKVTVDMLVIDHAEQTPTPN